MFQGEAGKDGLSVHGPPGPPGPPGAILNLQEVSSDIEWRTGDLPIGLDYSDVIALLVQLLLNDTAGALNFSGVFDAQGPKGPKGDKGIRGPPGPRVSVIMRRFSVRPC